MFSHVLKSQTPLLDAGRNSAAVILFVIWPIAQTFIPRSTPLFIVLAVVFILIFKGLGRFYGEREVAVPNIFALRLRHPLVIVGLLFTAVLTASLLWSPMPERGAKDIGVLIGGVLVAVFLAQELPRVTLMPLVGFVFLALALASVPMIAENWYFTSFYDALLPSNYLLDLNRNAVWLVLVACAALGFARTGWASKTAIWTIVIVAIAAVFSSQSEAAKLALVAAGGTALIARFASPLLKPLFVIFAVLIVAMPSLVEPLTDEKGKLRIALPKTAHAGHRIALWQGYAELAQEKPVWGWGAKADRALGMSGKAAKIAASRGYPKETTSPHSAALEIRINQGLVGTVLFALIVLLAGWTVSNLQRRVRISGVALLTAVFTVSMTGSSFYQGWWIASIATGFAIWGSTLRSKE